MGTAYRKTGTTLPTARELAAMGEAARRERDRLLAAHPHLQAYQREIDRVLAAAVTRENRMAALGLMMGAKLNELKAQMMRLEACTRALAGTVEI